MSISKRDVVGVWDSDPTDKEGLKSMGRVTLDFRPDGRLIYTIHGDAKDEIALLTYEVLNGRLITDQPSAPRREETALSMTSDGKLVFTYSGEQVRFVRVTAEPLQMK